MPSIFIVAKLASEVCFHLRVNNKKSICVIKFEIRNKSHSAEI